MSTPLGPNPLHQTPRFQCGSPTGLIRESINRIAQDGKYPSHAKAILEARLICSYSRFNGIVRTMRAEGVEIPPNPTGTKGAAKTRLERRLKGNTARDGRRYGQDASKTDGDGAQRGDQASSDQKSDPKPKGPWWPSWCPTRERPKYTAGWEALRSVREYYASRPADLRRQKGVT